MLKITHILYMVDERFSSLGLGWCVSLVRQESDGSSIINLCLESKRVISKKSKSKKERELKFSILGIAVMAVRRLLKQTSSGKILSPHFKGNKIL